MSTAARRSTAPARGRLSHEQVVSSALGLVDRDGLEALSLRRLAAELGVTPMALYWHVADKEALLDALGEHLFAGVELPEAHPDWAADLRAVSGAIVARLREHPAVAPLALATVLTCEPGVELAERVLARLSQAGLSDTAAAGTGAFLLGALCALVASVPTPGATPDQEERLRRKHAHLLDLPAGRHPSVQRMAPELVACDDPDAYVRQGVDVLILGIQALADRDTAPPARRRKR